MVIYQIEADWLIVADGARSAIRHMLGLEIDGKISWTVSSSLTS
jgi:3-(3-hydroxy-phenyl)propionate hydroxylase